MKILKEISSKNSLLAAGLVGVMLLTACADDGKDGIDGATGTDGTDGVSKLVTRDDVLKTNANIAYASYGDSLVTAIEMRDSLQALIDSPSEETLEQAKIAWVESREPYLQTEVYRFRAGPIDALKDDGTMGEEGDGPEGRINAWPLGEAIIDYVANAVDGDPNPENISSTSDINVNIIADTTNFPTIDMDVLKNNFELNGDERNVTTGYHAIEFLLWGQDLNIDGSGGGPRDTSAGSRPISDYYYEANGHLGQCTSGQGNGSNDNICERRAAYLLLAADLLIEDLQRLVDAWNPSGSDNYHQSFIAGGNVSLAKILEGMGRLAYGELAGERINIALLTNSQEDEHSCFSDNTHRDIYLDALGIQNVYQGKYVKVDGQIVEGAGINDLLVVEGHAELSNKLRASLEDTMAKVGVIDFRAKSGIPFDNQIQIGINEPNITSAINSLVAQTAVVEEAIKALGVTTGDLCQDTSEDIGSACGS
ncbi:imelysin family protein [Aliikangiella sp. IMCC44359]|uniref:imelysin family protein n=1 Tax=Aliikangiella sp. IMCC44359 TaxID=3459125 RepID=UPI00403B1ACF